MSEKDTPGKAQERKDDKAPAQSPAKIVKRVEVLVNNLGPKRHQKGAVTDDPEIVKLAGDGTGRVRVVE